jgi:WD40 repeat protein
MMTALLMTSLAFVFQIDSPRLLRNRPPISQAVFHPDGRRLYCVTHAGLEAYDTTTGKLLFDAPYGRHLTLSPRGDKLALVAASIGMIRIDGTIVVLDGDTGKKLHQGSGTSATFSPDGRWLISHSEYSIGHPATDLPPKVQITDLRTGKMQFASVKDDAEKKLNGFGPHRAASQFRFSKDCTILVGGAINGVGQFRASSACHLATGQTAPIPEDGDLLPITDPRLSNDGTRYLHEWTVFDVPNSKLLAKLQMPQNLDVSGWTLDCQLSADGKFVFGASSRTWKLPDDTKKYSTVTRASLLHVWDAETGKHLHSPIEAKWSMRLPTTTYKKIGNIHRSDPKFVVNRQATVAISHTADGTLTVWDLKRGAPLRTLRDAGHSTRPEHLAFRADGRQFATASTDGEVVLWDVESGRALRTLERAAHVNAIRIRPKSNELVGVGHGLIYVWNVETGELLRTFERKGNLFAVECHPDGRRIAVADYWSESVSLIDIESGETVRDLRGAGVGLAFHPDGTSLLTLYTNGAVGLWDVESGKRLQYWFGGGTGDSRFGAGQIAWLPGGTHFVLREKHNSIAIVDAKTGKRDPEFTVKNESRDTIRHMSVHPAGKRFAISRNSTTAIEERELPTGNLLRTLPGSAWSNSVVEYSPDGTRLAILGSYDFLIRIHATRKER